MTYDQAAVSGGQVLMHLCTYAIAMEPNKEKGYCILHPVKMRDAWFHPFPVRMDPDFNKVRELSVEEQQQILALHQMASGSNVVTTSSVNEETSGKTRLNNKTKQDNDDEEIVDVNKFEDEEIDLADWVL